MGLEAADVLLVRRDVEDIMRGVPPHHGFGEDSFGHVQIGTEYAGVLATLEGTDSRLAQVAYLVHDIRWWDSSERRARKIQIGHGLEEEGKSARDILGKLGVSGRMNEADFKQALDAAEKHSLHPHEDPKPSVLNRVIRDADRLTRLGVFGLVSILQANSFYGNVPFCQEGDQIVRSADAPIIPFDRINSCVADINACTGDWVRLMETSSGMILAQALSRVNQEFLKTFQTHTELNEYRIWIDWLNEIKASMRQNRLNLRVQLEGGQITANEYVERLVFLENPLLVNSDQFEFFLRK